MVQRKAQHIRTRLRAVVITAAPQRASKAQQLLVLIAEILLDIEQRLTHIERMEHTIMADESKNAADLAAMASDIAEVSTGIDGLKALVKAGNPAAVQTEIDKLTGSLDTVAASLRTAASQFDAPKPPAPAPSPTPAPAASRVGTGASKGPQKPGKR